MQPLGWDIAKLHEELNTRDAEIALLRAELELVRVLSKRQRASVGHSTTTTDERGSVMRSAWAFLRAAWRKLAVQQEAILKSGLFDDSWYLKRYPDVAKRGMNPLRHYLKFGAWEGRNPHPLFDTEWYGLTYPDAAMGGMTALGHFVCIGAAKGYDPNPLFHTKWYVVSNSDALETDVNPLRHYVDHASEKGRNPNPLFDSKWYLQENPDVAASGENPLAHYIHSGIAEQRDPHPLFDTQWYLETYKHVVANGMDALEHYLTVGAFEGCRPYPVFRREGKRRQIARIEGRVGRLANWLDAEEVTEPPLSSDPADVFAWQKKIRKPPAVAQFDGQIGVFVHLFYEDLAEEISAQVLAIPYPFKVYVSTNTDEKKAVIESAFRQQGIEPVVKVLPNRGWDIAAFVLGFADEVRKHDICLKLHGKRSRHNSRGYGAVWRRHLLSRLLGNARNVRFVVDTFVANSDVGVLMAPHWKGIARGVNVIGVNYLPMRALLKRAGLSISPDRPIEFPSGSMFWFRAAALGPLLDLGLTWHDFAECRARNRDATIAHGIERCILIFAAQAGFRWAFLPGRWGLRNWRVLHRAGRFQAMIKAARRNAR